MLSQGGRRREIPRAVDCEGEIQLAERVAELSALGGWKPDFRAGDGGQIRFTEPERSARDLTGRLSRRGGKIDLPKRRGKVRAWFRD